MIYRALITAPPILPQIMNYKLQFDNKSVEIVVPPYKVVESLNEDELIALVKNIDGSLCGDDKITEVVFYYTFNGQQTIIYGKPSFEPSKSVQTRHKINTSKANYIPPGLIITWHCLITDSQGNTTETKKQNFHYL